MTQSIPNARRSRRHLLFASLATGALIAATAASAEPASTIKVPAGSLESALLALSAQTHQQVMFPHDLVAGRTAPALAGTYTAEQAVRLLAPSDIAITRAGPSVLVLRKATATSGATPRPEVAAGRPFVGDPSSSPPPEALATAPIQTPAPATASTVSEVEVTGSHIRGAAPASPLLVLSRADLERSGQTTVADALRALPENFGGVAAEGNSLTGADGVGRNSAFGTGLNLRGLGNGATLVLINGHRLAGSGTFGDFADVSTIPTAAVERVEVLLDGASALYGSDAVGGVVNVIMRRDLDGAETRLLAGTATGGGASQGRISQTFGKSWSGGGVMFAYELQRRDQLKDADRPFAASADLRPLGGSDFRITNSFPGNILAINPANNSLVPGFAIPAGQNGVGLKPSDLRAGVINLQNPRQGEDILPQQTMNSVYLAANQALGDRLQLSADARYSFRRFRATSSPATSTLSVSTANPFYVSPTGAPSENIAYSFANDFPNPLQFGSVGTLGLTLDATLQLAGDWRSEAYATFAQEIDEVRLSHFPDSLFLNEALGNIPDNPATAFSTAHNGFFNPFAGIAGANSPTVLAFIDSGATWARSKDQVSSLNLQADGTVWRLPGGPLKLAVGAQARRETLFRTGSNLLSTAAPVPISTITDAARNVTAAFAELRAPLFGSDNARAGLERLELSVAGRVEHYQSFGTTANPSIGVLWAPTHDLQFRSTYSRSFRAPALRELYDPSALNPVLLSQGVAKVRTLELTGGNPNLRPETAVSWTAGMDFKPSAVPGLTLNLTGFDIRFRNRVDRPASVNIANALTDPTLSSFVQFISPSTKPADLALINKLLASAPLLTVNGVFQPTDYGAVVDVRYVNTASLHVQGLDFTGDYSFDAGGGRIALGANATYMLRYDQQLTPTASVIDRLNVANFPLRFRSRLTADWTRERLTIGGALNYVGAYHDSLGQNIGAQATVDLQARLAPAKTGLLKDISVLFNVRNVFDRAPPFYNNSQGFGYDPANADPIGRFISLELTRAW